MTNKLKALDYTGQNSPLEGESPKKKTSKKTLIWIIVGALFILAAAILNEWVLAYFASDGRINGGGQLLVIRVFDIVMVSAGVTIIVLRNSPLLPKLVASVVIMGITFLLIDSTLYFMAPLLPSSLVAAMSPNAQVKFYHANAESLPWVYDENIRYARPNTNVELFDMSITSDSLGYRNPVDYLEQGGHAEIVLLGDSFIWGTEEETIADYMREATPAHTIYSLGMAGSGISQWRYHYERYLADQEVPSQVAVLNFYSGNDITDTEVFLALQRANETVDSADYFTYINYQYLLPSRQRSFSLPKFPEFLFLLNYAFSAAKATQEKPSLQVNGNSMPVCMSHREPGVAMFNEEILSEIGLTADAIRSANPNTQIILSYIPTSSGIYGDRMTACPAYQGDIERQVANSVILADYANEIGIHYVDLTPALREKSETTPVWSFIDHFSPEGYKFYAEALAEEIERILSQS